MLSDSALSGVSAVKSETLPTPSISRDVTWLPVLMADIITAGSGPCSDRMNFKLLRLGTCSAVHWLGFQDVSSHHIMHSDNTVNPQQYVSASCFPSQPVMRRAHAMDVPC